MRQRRVFQIGADLLDDRVATVCLISGDGVQGAGGEERVEPEWGEEGSLPVGGILVQLGNAAHDQRAHDLVGLLLRGERGEGHIVDFRGGHPPARFFVPDRVRVFDRRPRGLIDRLHCPFDVGVHTCRDRYVRVGPDGSSHDGVGLERRIGPQQHLTCWVLDAQPGDGGEDVGNEFPRPAR